MTRGSRYLLRSKATIISHNRAAEKRTECELVVMPQEPAFFCKSEAMDPERLVELLENVRECRISVTDAVAQMRHLPFEDLGFAKIDHHRALRQGFPEVVMGQGKEPKDIAAIVRAMRRQKTNVW